MHVQARSARALRVLLAVGALALAGTLTLTAFAAKPLPKGPIAYHGGQVMNRLPDVDLIWYGNWDSSSMALLSAFSVNLGGTPYWNINTTYGDAAGIPIPNLQWFVSRTSVGYPYGTALTDANVLSIVNDAITSGALSSSPNAVYVVLTSADVDETSGFGAQYCYWHNHATLGGNDIKYAFVGDP